MNRPPVTGSSSFAVWSTADYNFIHRFTHFLNFE